MDNGTLIGFTLTNGATLSTVTTDGDGGGIYSIDTTPIISNCVIIGNSSGHKGDGAFGGVLVDCTVSGNRGSVGVFRSALSNCAVINNQGDIGAQNCTLVNCLVAGNFGGAYGGVVFSGGAIYQFRQLSIKFCAGSAGFDCKYFLITRAKAVRVITG